jgi:hypothetical protein
MSRESYAFPGSSSTTHTSVTGVERAIAYGVVGMAAGAMRIGMIAVGASVNIE